MARFRQARPRQPEVSIAVRILGRSAELFNHTVSAVRARPRIGLAAVGLIMAGLVAGVMPSSQPDPVAMRVTTIDLPELGTNGDTPAPEVETNGSRRVEPLPSQTNTSAASGPLPATTPDYGVENWKTVEVQPGQTMERIFRELGLSANLLHKVVNASEETDRLARIRPGEEFAFDIDKDNGFRALRAELDEEYWLFVERNDESITARTEPRELDSRIVEANGTITTSLYRAAREAELSDNMIMRLANIFGWDIDFALDIRAGDRFALIYEEVWRDGEYLRDGPILAARFVNQGENFEALRFDAGNGPDYFAPDGRPMRKAFLRTPLNFTRVSSNFNPRRMHPVTRRVRPHNGTDYAANTGTPVWAAGDGKVVETGYTRANGNYIFIQHGNKFVTRYLHLSKKIVKRGDRVRQGQTIGHVGSTGLATGPHLHYEFLVNGTHRNPRTVDLPPADPLPENYMDAFKRASKSMITRLDSIDQPNLRMASADADDNCDPSGGSC